MFLQATFGQCSRRKSLPSATTGCWSKASKYPFKTLTRALQALLLRFTRLFIMRYTHLACLRLYKIAVFTDNFSFGSLHALHASLRIFLKIETVQVTSHVFSSHVISYCCQFQGLQYCRKNLIILKEFLRFRCLGSPYTSTHTHKMSKYFLQVYLSTKRHFSFWGKNISWLT